VAAGSHPVLQNRPARATEGQQKGGEQAAKAGAIGWYAKLLLSSSEDNPESIACEELGAAMESQFTVGLPTPSCASHSGVMAPASPVQARVETRGGWVACVDLTSVAMAPFPSSSPFKFRSTGPVAHPTGESPPQGAPVVRLSQSAQRLL